MARERMCIACRERASDPELVRLVVDPAGEVVIDLRGRLPGRGAWIHPAAPCVERVVKRPDTLRRALKGPVAVDALHERLVDAVVRAATDGLSLAAAAGALVSGHDALERALTAGQVAVIAVASDASERTLQDLQQAAREDTSFVTVPLDRAALGHRIGCGPRAAVGVGPSKAAAHLRQQLRRLRQLR